MEDYKSEDKYAKQREDIERGFVDCDDFCQAKEKPDSLEEYKATLEHYKNHSLLSGCSHGR